MNTSTRTSFHISLPHPDITRTTLIAFPLLIAVAWAYITTKQANGGLDQLVSTQNWEAVRLLLDRLLGSEDAVGRVSYLEPSRWRDMLALAYETLAMSVLAISIATLGMLLTVMFGTRSFVNEEAALSGHTLRLTIYSLVRAVWISTRAVPELIWALLVVFFIQQGLLAGALARGIHNFGILGRLCSEVVEDLDPRQIRALRGAGSGRGQLLFYGVLPQVLPQFLTYILYRWEVVIRTTIVVGFVAAGGLGREFRLAMSFFHWTDITLILVTYFLLVLVVDVISSILRRFAQ